MSSANRAERRRREREALKAHQPTSPAHRDPQGHEWTALVPFSLTQHQARLFYEGGELIGAEIIDELHPGSEPPGDDPRVFLRASMIRHELANVGCLRCERPWTPEAAARPCRGEPRGYQPDGTPAW
jgi:hypothetical protein